MVDVLAAAGYERSELQVRKKFERMRHDSRYQDVDLLTFQERLIESLGGGMFNNEKPSIYEK